MRLKQLVLENFRNYESLSLDLSEADVLALIGPNAQGKTNLLESIAFLALGKSFRARRSMETLMWDRPHGRIRGVLENDKKETPLEVFFQRSPEQRKVKKHDKVVPPKEFLGHFQVVLFTPEHLQLVSGSPRLRRQYLDRVLVQLDRGYVEALGQYQQILKQRNALLKRVHNREAQDWELDLWDARLITEAQRLWKSRHALGTFLNEAIVPLYKELSGSEQHLKWQLHTHEDQFEDRLMAHRESDIRMGSTSVGPHRDDFSLHLEGRALAETGSRGECRSAVLALKMAEIRYIHELSGQKPLLLLDDVFSELDEDRQTQLGRMLKGHQSILTTTSMDHVKGLEGAKICQVKAGCLT